jgi:HAD superfamily hydrolase (TIGR01509 family)
MNNIPFIKVAFFDLGETLVGNNGDWIPGAQETLAQLSEKQIRLGLISNTADLLRPAILDLLPEDFDLGIFEEELVIFSSEVDVAKPAPEIFRLAVQRAGVNSAECLFCSEELSHLLVAQQEGMQTASVRKPPDSDIGELIDVLVSRHLLPG